MIVVILLHMLMQIYLYNSKWNGTKKLKLKLILFLVSISLSFQVVAEDWKLVPGSS